MTLTATSATPQTQCQQQRSMLQAKRNGEYGSGGSFRIKKYPQRLLTILICLCCLFDFIVALKDVSVTIPQAVKRGSNAMLTCNYDMENDTLYSVKWYKGRREFYRYTPKENPAMKVFPSQSGLNVERNLSNQSHIVLLAVPLNISGKFTCEISVEAPSFQTAMVSGEMEVVELPEEQATVTGIQPRYRIGDLVDGNCSIKYSKPAANLTWTINGIVVPPHHIKSYQIEKYEETNLESVMSAVHFMVTTQHFIKSQMRLKCTASIFDIFKEEIESIIEEDRPRIMASGQSYPSDHAYGSPGENDGYDHNESYLTYFSAAPKSSASPTADCVLSKIIRLLKQKTIKYFQPFMTLIETNSQRFPIMTLTKKFKSAFKLGNSMEIKDTTSNTIQFIPKGFKAVALAILLWVVCSQKVQRNVVAKRLRINMTHDKQMAYNCIENFRQQMKKQKENFSFMNFWQETLYRNKKRQQNLSGHCYRNANNDVCQTECEQQGYERCQHEEHRVVAHQNLVNEKTLANDTNINTINKNTNKKIIATVTTDIDCQRHMSPAIPYAALPPTSCDCVIRSPSSLPCNTPALHSSTSTSTSKLPVSLSSASALWPSAMGCRKKYALDSFPLCTVDASKSNNAKCMSRDQTLLMTFAVTAANVVATATPPATLSLHETPLPAATPLTALVLESQLLQTSVHTPLAYTAGTNSHPVTKFSWNNNLMAFIGELLLHQC